MPWRAIKVGEVNGRRERPSRARERADSRELRNPEMHMQTRSRSRDDNERYAYFILEWDSKPRAKKRRSGVPATPKTRTAKSANRKPLSRRKKRAARRREEREDDEYADVNVEEIVGGAVNAEEMAPPHRATGAPVRDVSARQVDGLRRSAEGAPPSPRPVRMASERLQRFRYVEKASPQSESNNEEGASRATAGFPRKSLEAQRRAKNLKSSREPKTPGRKFNADAPHRAEDSDSDTYDTAPLWAEAPQSSSTTPRREQSNTKVKITMQISTPRQEGAGTSGRSPTTQRKSRRLRETKKPSANEVDSESDSDISVPHEEEAEASKSSKQHAKSGANGRETLAPRKRAAGGLSVTFALLEESEATPPQRRTPVKLESNSGSSTDGEDDTDAAEFYEAFNSYDDSQGGTETDTSVERNSREKPGNVNSKGRASSRRVEPEDQPEATESTGRPLEKSESLKTKENSADGDNSREEAEVQQRSDTTTKGTSQKKTKENARNRKQSSTDEGEGDLDASTSSEEVVPTSQDPSHDLRKSKQLKDKGGASSHQTADEAPAGAEPPDRGAATPSQPRAQKKSAKVLDNDEELRGTSEEAPEAPQQSSQDQDKSKKPGRKSRQTSTLKKTTSVREAEDGSSEPTAMRTSSRLRDSAERQPSTTATPSRSKMQLQRPKSKPKLRDIIPQTVQETDETSEPDETRESSEEKAGGSFDALMNTSTSLFDTQSSSSSEPRDQPNPSIFDVSGPSVDLEQDAAAPDDLRFNANVTIRSSRQAMRETSTLNLRPEDDGARNAAMPEASEAEFDGGDLSDELLSTTRRPESFPSPPPRRASPDERDKVFVPLPHHQATWKVVEESLAEPVEDVEALKVKMRRYNPTKSWQLRGLEHLLSTAQPPLAALILRIVRDIQTQALSLPTVAKDTRIRLLRTKRTDGLTLGKDVVLALLANGFLCTFAGDARDVTGPRLNLAQLLEAHTGDEDNSLVTQKLLGLLRYFRRGPRDGNVMVTRVYLPRAEAPNWRALDVPFGAVDVHMERASELDGRGARQLIFSGGDGVLGCGATPEDVAFVAMPELLVTRLLVESLGEGEALLVDGVHPAVNTSGSDKSFLVEGTYRADEESRSVAIVQADEPAQDEFFGTLNKLDAAMSGWGGTVVASVHGHGCQTTRFLLVAMAAARHHLKLHFYCNSQKVWHDDVQLVYRIIVEHGLKVATVLRVLYERDTASLEPLWSCLKNRASAG